MLFNSWQYAIFLPTVFILYWSMPHCLRCHLLLVASYFFYMSWDAKYISLILFATVVSFSAAILLEHTSTKRYRKLILIVTIVACIGILFMFKYYNFFMDSAIAVLQQFAIPLEPTTLKLLLPVGISFYTFQTCSYVIDVYRGEVQAERSFSVYATFVSFFPQLVAGPIERASTLLPQIKADHKFNYEKATYGLKLMAWGLFKKMVIADHIAVYSDKVFDNIYSFEGFSLVLAAFLFTIQIYCDFSGYSDIARGSAKLLGINLMENFKSPYFSASIHEFWSRWHISLSTWFRDYVYIPLGGNRVRRVIHYRNLLVTFLVSGLWHGAGSVFIFWGGTHGLALISEIATPIRWEERRGTFCWWSRVIICFTFVMFAWVFFRAQSFDEAAYLFRHMLDGVNHPGGYLFNGFSTRYGMGLGIDKLELFRIIASVCLLGVYDYVSLKTDVINVLSKQKTIMRWLIYVGIVSIIFAHYSFGRTAAFMYFQF